jgi:porin
MRTLANKRKVLVETRRVLALTGLAAALIIDTPFQVRPAAAAEPAELVAPARPTVKPENPAPAKNDAAEDKTLLGDFGGVRPWLTGFGATLGLVETSEILANPIGGRRQGAIYEGLTDLSLGIDFRRYFYWRGIFLVRAYQIHGRGISANNLDNLNTASNLEATRTTRLFELWYEQRFGDWLRIRIGQQNAGQEFLISTTANLFVNATFGWPTLPSLDLPSGGPTYPLGTPALRFRVDATDAFTLFAGVFNGDPAGPGIGDPQRRDASGTAFRVNDGILALFELRYNPENSNQNGTYKLGAWFNSERFSDLRRDTTGGSLASPTSTGIPTSHSHDASLYAIVDQPLFGAKAAEAGLAVFARAMGAPGDRNLVDFYLDGGVSYKGPFGRSGDTIGLAIAHARIGKAARALDADSARFAMQPLPIRSNETVVELSYQFQLTPWWQVQPDFQYIINPGGGVLNPTVSGNRLGDAALFGLRTRITF